MSVDKVQHALEGAVAKVAEQAQEMAAAAGNVMEGALKAHRYKRGVVMRTRELGIELAAAQPRGVYQEGASGISLQAGELVDASADFAQQLANSAAATITGGIS